jgi:hypothetical protein
MKPLKQWICDTCDELIENVQDGWLEWINEHGDQGAHSFRIVHRKSRSPLPKGCYQHENERGRSDLDLDQYVDPDRVGALYRFLHIGPLHDPENSKPPQVQNIPEFMEIIRRLTIPYYEEARLYWENAEEDGFFDGVNENWPYMSDNLKHLIVTYKS